MGSILSLLVPSVTAPSGSEDKSTNSILPGGQGLLGNPGQGGSLFSELLTSTGVPADGKAVAALQKAGKLQVMPDVLKVTAAAEKGLATSYEEFFKPFTLTADTLTQVQASNVAAPVVNHGQDVRKIAGSFPVEEMVSQLKSLQQEFKDTKGKNIPTPSPVHQAQAASQQQYQDLLAQWSIEGADAATMPLPPEGLRFVKAGDDFSILSGEAETNPILDYSLQGGEQVEIPPAAVLPSTVPTEPEVQSNEDAAPEAVLSATDNQKKTAPEFADLDDAADDFLQKQHANDNGQAIKQFVENVTNTVKQEGPRFILQDNANKPLVDNATVIPPITFASHGTTSTVASAHAATPASVITPSQVHEQVQVKIRQALDGGQDEVHIKMDPPELGRVDVKMQIAQDGKTHVMFQVEQKDTLDLLQRDLKGLERALQESGLKADSGSMQFNLRQDQQENRFGQQESSQGFTPFYGDDEEYGTKDALLSGNVTETNLQIAVTGGLDLKV